MSHDGTAPRSPFVTSVRIRNYKSIAHCAVDLGRFTVLVGRNGSGKSNFLDALRFVSDSLESSLDHAIKERAGIDAVRRISTGHPRNFSIGLRLWLEATSQLADYAFEVSARSRGEFVVKMERLSLYSPGGTAAISTDPSQTTDQGKLALPPTMSPVAHYWVDQGQIRQASTSSVPPVSEDRLFLVNAAGLPDFRPAYDALTSMGFYNLSPEAIRDLQSPDAGELLRRDGGNIASVVARLARENPTAHARIEEYLEKIVPGITGFERIALGPRESLQFRQRVHGSQHPWKFYAANMSDGTLRALGLLVAVNQLEARHQATFVGIEEPETALHPAAAGALMDALRSGSQRTQIAITSHSPDLLDCIDVEEDTLLVVQNVDGTSQIAGIDPASRQAIKQHLYTAGEMLRMDQLEPDRDELRRQDQLDFWPQGVM